MPILLDLIFVAIAVGVLWIAADWFVDGAVGLATKLEVPEMLVGIVFVSVATTSPELMTSLLASLRGMPDVALGNAVGSVIADDTLALGLAALIAATPLVATPRILHTSAVVLVGVAILCFGMTLDGELARWQGAILVCCFLGYSAFSYLDELRQKRMGIAAPDHGVEEHEAITHAPLRKVISLFAAGFFGVFLGSKLLLHGAIGIAEFLEIPSVIMGLTVIAIGTSVPEIATCVIAARKGKSGLAIGNIIGADILNICLVAGLSSVANPLSAKKHEILFMFPAMLIVVFTMLAMLRFGYNLTRRNGIVLLSLYLAYVIVMCLIPGTGEAPAVP
jgi:cation:H+ antiporter